MADIDQEAQAPDGTDFTRTLEDLGDGSHAPGQVLYLRKTDGTYVEAAGNADGSLILSDRGHQVALGNVAGEKAFHLAGRRDGVSTANLEDLTETGMDVLPRPAGATIDLVFASGDDDVAGSGVQVVEIEYLDINGDEQQLQCNSNGGTVADVGGGTIYDVQWMHGQQIGGGALGIAAGNITLLNQGDNAIVYERINAGGNQSLSARYKVPRAKKGLVTGWDASAITRKVDFRLRADVDRFSRALQTGVFNFQAVEVLEQVASGWLPFDPPLLMPALSTVKISAISFAGAGDGGGNFSITLIDD